MGHPSQLVNPVTLTLISAVPMVRGLGYIIVDLFPSWPISVESVGPSIPYLPLWLVGVMWMFLGLSMFASLWMWRLFKLSTALCVGMYITWSILYVMDLFLSPDVVSITSLASYIAMVPTIITLVGIEIDRESVRDLEVSVTDPASGAESVRGVAWNQQP